MFMSKAWLPVCNAVPSGTCADFGSHGMMRNQRSRPRAAANYRAGTTRVQHDLHQPSTARARPLGAA